MLDPDFGSFGLEDFGPEFDLWLGSRSCYRFSRGYRAGLPPSQMNSLTSLLLLDPFGKPPNHYKRWGQEVV